MKLTSIYYLMSEPKKCIKFLKKKVDTQEKPFYIWRLIHLWTLDFFFSFNVDGYKMMILIYYIYLKIKEVREIKLRIVP